MSGKLILTSTGFRNPEVAGIISQHFDGEVGLKVVLITTAAEGKALNPFVLNKRKLLKKA